MLTREQFDRTRKLALRLAGIELVDRHRELLHRRGGRRGILDGSGWEALLNAAEKGEMAARQKLLCLLTTKFTGFFRHPHQIARAAAHGLLMADRHGRACIWSAGSATGEEAYSLAMALIEQSRSDNPPVSILATDVDAEALATAERGEYSDAALCALDPARRRRFFAAASRPRCREVVQAVRRLVEFRPLNLIHKTWPVEGPFDVILCRNVLMYLDASHRQEVLKHMASLLRPEGLLLIDPAEHLGRAGHLFTAEADAIFRRRVPSSSSHIAVEL
jgi:chemotaxis protein methyltransferase CheR